MIHHLITVLQRCGLVNFPTTCEDAKPHLVQSHKMHRSVVCRMWQPPLPLHIVWMFVRLCKDVHACPLDVYEVLIVYGHWAFHSQCIQ